MAVVATVTVMENSGSRNVGSNCNCNSVSGADNDDDSSGNEDNINDDDGSSSSGAAGNAMGIIQIFALKPGNIFSPSDTVPTTHAVVGGRPDQVHPPSPMVWV